MTNSQGAPVPVLFLKREPDTPPAGWNEGMTLDASNQPVTSVASALQLPVIFGAEVRWDFLVAPADNPDQTNARFNLIRRPARRLQLRGTRGSGNAWQRPRTAGLPKRHKRGLWRGLARGAPSVRRH